MTLKKKPFQYCGKGDNSGDQHFHYQHSLFPLMFSTSFDSYFLIKSYTTQSGLLMTPRKKPFENIERKVENANIKSLFNILQ